MNKKTDRILLVSTGYSPGNEADSGLTQLQLGQLYLATVLEKRGYSVKLYSNLFPEPEEFLNIIEKGNFSIVGFYSTSNIIERIKALVELVKKEFPSIMVFLGGPHPTVQDRELLLECSADLIMRHEAEYTFPEVLDYYYEKKGNLGNIKGITFRSNEDIIRTPDREFIKDLDSLPVPNWNLLEGDLAELNHRYPSIITGRGCPFKCAFCFEAFGGSIYRLRSAGHVMQEIDMLLENRDVKYIKFMDDTFVVDTERVEKICDYLIEKRKNHDFYWFCEARVDILNKRLNLLNKMKEAGLAVLQIGVESGNQEILDIYNKKITLEEIENVVKACVEANIFCMSVNVIIGGPFETEKTLEKTTRFIKKLIKMAPGRVFPQSSILTPYKDTAITEDPKKFGLINRDPELLGGQTEETCFMESKELNRYDIYRGRSKFEREILNTMKEELPNIPPSLIEEHIRLTEYAIKTSWHMVIMADDGVKKYFNLKAHNLYRSFMELPSDEIEDWCPLRTYPLEYRDKKIILNTLNSPIEFNQKETLFYEYSSGKLSFSEILEILTIKTGKNRDELKEEMMDFYRKADSIYAVIFSRI